MAVEGDKKTVLRPGNEKLRILIASNTVQKMCEIFTDRRKRERADNCLSLSSTFKALRLSHPMCDTSLTMYINFCCENVLSN